LGLGFDEVLSNNNNLTVNKTDGEAEETAYAWVEVKFYLTYTDE
jgi:hypothetical protein